MRYWVYSICQDIDQPETESGWIKAPSATEALQLVGHPDAQVTEVPDDTAFPSQMATNIYREAG